MICFSAWRCMTPNGTRQQKWNTRQPIWSFTAEPAGAQIRVEQYVEIDGPEDVSWSNLARPRPNAATRMCSSLRVPTLRELPCHGRVVSRSTTHLWSPAPSSLHDQCSRCRLQSQIPQDFVYIPPGTIPVWRERRRHACAKCILAGGAAPSGSRPIPTLIAASMKTTFAEWIEFLEALPPAERQKRDATKAQGRQLAAWSGGVLELTQPKCMRPSYAADPCSPKTRRI